MSNQDNARQFSLDLDAFGERVPAEALAFQKKVALDALAGVVKKSPVDTGRFRGNWQVNSTGAAPVIDAQDKAPRGAGPGSSVTAAATAALAGAQPYGTLYVTNGLPYAQRLEDGYSKQAPGGMVALTLAELQAQIDEVTR